MVHKLCPERDEALNVFDLETLLCRFRNDDLHKYDDHVDFFVVFLSVKDFAKKYAEWFKA